MYMYNGILLFIVQLPSRVYLWPHGLQHARLLCPSPSPRACSNSCPLVQWHHSTFSSSAAPFSPALNLSPHQGLFQWVGSSYQACIGQSIGASASVLPINIQDWFRLGLTSLISLLSKGLSRIFYNTTVQKHQFFSVQPSLWSNSHICTWLLEKPQLRLYGPLLAKWRLCFLILQWNITQLQKRMKFCLLQQYELSEILCFMK